MRETLANWLPRPLASRTTHTGTFSLAQKPFQSQNLRIAPRRPAQTGRSMPSYSHLHASRSPHGIAARTVCADVDESYKGKTVKRAPPVTLARVCKWRDVKIKKQNLQSNKQLLVRKRRWSWSRVTQMIVLCKSLIALCGWFR